MYIGSSYNIKNKISRNLIVINNIPVPRTGTYTCLGVSLDERLTWEKHINTICAKVGAGIGVMRRMKPFVPPETLKLTYEALVQPYFNYCSPLWDNCGIGLKDKLQKFQNRVARVITGSTYDIRSIDVLDQLGWETEQKRNYTKSMLMYKITRRLQRRSLRLPTRSKSAQTGHLCTTAQAGADPGVFVCRSKFPGLKVGRRS